MKNPSYDILEPLDAHALFSAGADREVFIPIKRKLGVWLKYVGLCLFLFGGIFAVITSDVGRLDEAIIPFFMYVPLLVFLIHWIRTRSSPLSTATHFLILKNEGALVGLLPAQKMHEAYAVQFTLEGMRTAEKDEAHVIAKNLRQKNLKLPRFYYKMDHTHKKKIPDQVYELSEIDMQWEFRPTRMVSGQWVTTF